MIFKLLIIAVSILLSLGCATIQDVNLARMHINNVWKSEDQKIKMDIGTKILDAPYDLTYEAVIKTLIRLGFSIEKHKTDTGVIYAIAQAPTPLSEAEWDEVKRTEEPKTKKMASPYLGLSSIFAGLHTDGVEVHIITFIESVEKGTRVSFDYILLDHKAEAMGLNPKTYAPPTAARIGTIKAFKELDEQMLLLDKGALKKN